MKKKRRYSKKGIFHKNGTPVAEVPVDVSERLESFATPLLNSLSRTNQRKAFAYMKGLMSDIKKKSTETIAYYNNGDRQTLQKFIGQVDWDDAIILDKLAERICQKNGTEDGILILGQNYFIKNRKGAQSVGVERRIHPHKNMTKTFQEATFLTYAGWEESALVDRRL